ncbi:MAG TPA: phosphoribosylanthranilate isomerase [Methylococcaceae bacterium]|nr:phosphoribosylanthranilate isomerase [Methylococcaceae bacterium]
MRTRVKICGFTRAEDARIAAHLGADALGLVFYPSSPRHVSVEQARAIVAALPAFVTVVGLFVEAAADEVQAVREAVRLDLLQFHGDEPPEYCRSFGAPYLKAVRMREGVEISALARDYRDAAGLLLDAWHPDEKGGTGLSFDWARARKACGLPIVLAGGLTAGNVAQAIRVARPYAVDVSSGVEAKKGIKDANKMAAFMREVNQT